MDTIAMGCCLLEITTANAVGFGNAKIEMKQERS